MTSSRAPTSPPPRAARTPARRAGTGTGLAGHRLMVETTHLELSADERGVLRQALQHYVSNLREEIAKTEKHGWRVALHAEEEALQRIIARL